MKKVIIISSFTAFVLFAVSCNSSSTNAKSSTEMQNVSAEVYYTCTMHPEVHSDKPGNCPKCGMELVKKEAAKSDSTHMHHDADSAEHHH